MLFFVNSHSQNLDKIRESDTIYIYFDDKDLNQIHHIEKVPNKGLHYETYFFEFNNQNSIEFTHHYIIAKERRYEKKCFLKKNKDIIVNYQFLKKMGLVDATKLFFSNTGKKKKIYIIEKKTIGWFKIFLKEVSTPGLLPMYDE